MLLNLMVKGNGSRTEIMSAQQNYLKISLLPTNYETTKECINPSHNQCLRDHHGHIPLHHAHHPLHSSRICHWIWGGLSFSVWLLQICTILILCNQKVFTRLERSGRYNIRIVSKVDTSEECSLFSDRWELLLLGCGGH
jgi:hypothetical protein